MNRALRGLLCCGGMASQAPSGTLSRPQGSHAVRTRKANRTKSRACASISTSARRLRAHWARPRKFQQCERWRCRASCRRTSAVRHSELVAFRQVGAQSPNGTVAVFVCARTGVRGGRGSQSGLMKLQVSVPSPVAWHWLLPCRQSLDAMRATVLCATRSAQCPSWPVRRGRGC